MKLWLIVPVKPFDEGKSRLVAALAAEERIALNRRLLSHVLNAAQQSELLAGVLVVSRDAGALEQAADLGAVPLSEEGCSLNSALDQARRHAVELGADALLVLPADLPLLTAGDLTRLCALASTAPVVVISPSQDNGTSALLLRPPDLLPFAFGPHSFVHHCRLAATAGATCRVLHSNTLAFDLDRPEDLAVVPVEG